MEHPAMQLWYCLKTVKPMQSWMNSTPEQSPRISVSFVNFCDVFVMNLCLKTNVNELLWTKFRVLKLLELTVKSVGGLGRFSRSDFKTLHGSNSGSIHPRCMIFSRYDGRNVLVTRTKYQQSVSSSCWTVAVQKRPSNCPGTTHEFHETCHSVMIYFMKNLCYITK